MRKRERSLSSQVEIEKEGIYAKVSLVNQGGEEDEFL